MVYITVLSVCSQITLAVPYGIIMKDTDMNMENEDYAIEDKEMMVMMERWLWSPWGTRK